MKKLLALLVIMAGTTVFAETNLNMSVNTTTCTKGDCFTHGWQTRGPNVRTRLECVDSDCINSGWTISNLLNGAEAEAVCRREGCFVQGWSIYDAFDGRRLSQTTCGYGELEDGTEEQDCLKYGWEINSVNQANQLVECVNESCTENGWTVTVRGSHVAEVVCNNSACFEEGWRTFY